MHQSFFNLLSREEVMESSNNNNKFLTNGDNAKQISPTSTELLESSSDNHNNLLQWLNLGNTEKRSYRNSESYTTARKIDSTKNHKYIIPRFMITKSFSC